MLWELGRGQYGCINVKTPHAQEVNKTCPFDVLKHFINGHRLLHSLLTLDQRKFVLNALPPDYQVDAAHTVSGYPAEQVRNKFEEFQSHETVRRVNKDEAAALQRVQGHDHIVKLLGFDELLCILHLERCAGDVTVLMHNNYRFDVYVLAQLPSALRHLQYQRVVHGDIKPENILFKRSPSGRVVLKLCDFGLAEPVGAIAFARYKYTEGYRCFELMTCRDEDAEVELKCEHDWWAMGITLLELLIYHKRGRLYAQMAALTSGLAQQLFIERLLQLIRCRVTQNALRQMLHVWPRQRRLPSDWV